MSEKRELTFDELETVVGGTDSESGTIAESKLQELRDAAKALGKTFTPHQLEALADKWEKDGFKPSAEEFLKDK